MLTNYFWQGNIEQKCRMLEMKYELNLPVMPSFISGRGYELICEISDIISDKKKIIKVAVNGKRFCNFFGIFLLLSFWESVEKFL